MQPDVDVARWIHIDAVLCNISLLHLSQVPSAGILSNGTGYLFYKYYHYGPQRLQCSPLMVQNLIQGIEAKAAKKEAMDVLATMIQLFKDQISAFEDFKASQSP